MKKITDLLFGIGLILFGIASSLNVYFFDQQWMGIFAIYSPIIGFIILLLSLFIKSENPYKSNAIQNNKE